MRSNAMNETVEPWLTRSEAAEVLRACGYPVSPKTLASMVSRGGGPAFHRFGRRVLYRRSELFAWAEARLSSPAPAALNPASLAPAYGRACGRGRAEALTM
jgi:hypothetical protein